MKKNKFMLQKFYNWNSHDGYCGSIYPIESFETLEEGMEALAKTKLDGEVSWIHYELVKVVG